MMGQYHGSPEGRGPESRPGAPPRLESDREVVREVVRRSYIDREVVRRSYIDRDGLTWEVREVSGADVPGARGGKCLVFESPVVIRRVWDVPPDWRALSGEELSELSWRK